eukprot:CAMPEP_0197574846 /NCGR_PEP_ID=MMETSP1326-20131121/436_1 /TAXON_ID=1155430 /ORGANISM="Genus nov. species nov., Strain RCC2288" /LENGTH=118 /DNA_ID=CAMNT_0043137499 /DNA_START=500 /DNA_END=856 /DNA_ORIENTATION=+
MPALRRAREGAGLALLHHHGRGRDHHHQPGDGPTQVLHVRLVRHFDYNYWSHQLHGAAYASQRTVFDDLGHDVFENAWNGYNVCMFAYGQTGSGKSYKLVAVNINISAKQALAYLFQN